MKIKVAVCVSDRIARDPIDRYVELEGEMVDHYSGTKKLAIKSPRWPQGQFPGVWVANDVPMIAARDMKPKPHSQRRRRSSRWKHWTFDG